MSYWAYYRITQNLRSAALVIRMRADEMAFVHVLYMYVCMESLGLCVATADSTESFALYESIYEHRKIKFVK